MNGYVGDFPVNATVQLREETFAMAVDATDLKTPETGLSRFTVSRSRNGASPILSRF
jgi:hypothetical protein